VNGELLLREEFERALAALARDRREPLDDKMRRHVLDRLIDEELLVQRGLELGLPHHDRRVRADLSAAVIASVVSDAEEEEPNTDDLERFYRERRDFFTRPGRVRVGQVFVRVSGGEEQALARARAAAQQLRAGEPFATVTLALGDEPVAPLPDALLPPAKLREYLGPTALRATLELEAGGVSHPVRSGAGYHVIALREREPATVPPLAEIEPEVRAEYRRRAGERALRRYLDELRRRADVTIAAGLP
jgi:parvulin-like peptidyl-prolyl isomerase